VIGKMSEQAKPAEAFKIWRNPARREEPIVFMGDFYPPEGHIYFTPKDLRELGFAPGAYTILTPEHERHSGSPKWRKVCLSDD
jgi:hypothetical protein